MYISIFLQSTVIEFLILYSTPVSCDILVQSCLTCGLHDKLSSVVVPKNLMLLTLTKILLFFETLRLLTFLLTYDDTK